MKLAVSFLAAFLLGSSSLIAAPAIVGGPLVTWNISGLIYNVSSGLQGGGISAGDALNASLTYDLSIPPVFNDNSLRGYFNLTQVTLDVGTFHYSGYPGNNAQIDLYGPTTSPAGQVNIGLYPGGTINGHGITELTMQLDTPTGPGMTPYLTATSAPIVADYSGRALTFFIDLGAYVINGTVTDITVAPEPSSRAMLWLAGAVFLAMAARRKRGGPMMSTSIATDREGGG